MGRSRFVRSFCSSDSSSQIAHPFPSVKLCAYDLLANSLSSLATDSLRSSATPARTTRWPNFTTPRTSSTHRTLLALLHLLQRRPHHHYGGVLKKKTARHHRHPPKEPIIRSTHQEDTVVELCVRSDNTSPVPSHHRR